MKDQDTIHHTVAFKLKWDKDSSQERAFLEESRAILANLPGVRNFTINRQISLKNKYDFELTMDFSSLEDYDAYGAHPDHQAYVHDKWLVQVVEFLEKDTVVYK